MNKETVKQFCTDNGITLEKFLKVFDFIMKEFRNSCE